jgi:hypothetical protein
LLATGYRQLESKLVETRDRDAVNVDQALSELTAEYAGLYATMRPSFPVPLIHTITTPAAMRLVLAELPTQLHEASLRPMVEVNRELFAAFGGQRLTATPDAAARENTLRPDPRYFSAASTALTLIRKL